VLEQVARLLPAGPIKGRHVELIAAPISARRGEYNMILAKSRESNRQQVPRGARRVSPDQMAEDVAREARRDGHDYESTWPARSERWTSASRRPPRSPRTRLDPKPGFAIVEQARTLVSFTW